MADLKCAFEIIRPFNSVFAGAAVLVGMYVEAGTQAVYSPIGLFAFFSVMLITAAGNIFNDYFDLESDAINKPKRPIPSGRISENAALMLGFALGFVGIFAAYSINKNTMLLGLINLVVLYFYSRIKEKTPFGNLIVAYLTGSIFLFGGLAAGSFAKVGIFAQLAGLATLAREITKDIEDEKGDKFRKTTLATYYGDRIAGIVGGVVLVSAIFLSILPLKKAFFGTGYLYAIFVADCIFAYCAYRLVAAPATYASDIQRLEKFGMLVALIAFVLG